MLRFKSFSVILCAMLLLALLATVAYGRDGAPGARPERSYLKGNGGHWQEVTRQGGKTSVLEPHAAAPAPASETATADAASYPLFKSYQAFDVGSWPEAVAIGDVNGDGRNDVAMTTSFYFDPANDYHLFVFLQDDEGGLAAPLKHPIAGTGDSVDVGDVNNDGRDDVVVGNERNNIQVFLQNAAGGLDLPVTHSTNNALKVRIADLNNDLRQDVVSIAWGSYNDLVKVFLQNESGTLNPPLNYTVLHGGYDDLDVGDVNDDGLTDIVVMSGQSYGYDNVGILIQSPSGGFNPAEYYDLGGNQLTSGVAVGDISGDRLEDVVVTYNNNIGAFLQNSNGTLDAPLTYPAGRTPEPIEVADFNFDSRGDIVVAHSGSYLSVQRQGSDGSLQPYASYRLPYATHYNPHGLDVGDINSDGAPDVVSANYNSGLVVLYHTPPPMVDVKANGSDGPLTITRRDPLRVTISLEPTAMTGEVRDWWISQEVGPRTYWYVLGAGWVNSQTPLRVSDGPLVLQSDLVVLDSRGERHDDYTYTIALDENADGIYDPAYIDSVTVTVVK